MKIGVFVPNWIGDVAMATPTLRALRKHYGDEAEIVGILRPYVADVLAGTRWLDRQILFNPKSADRSHGTRAVLATMSHERFDTIVMLTHSLRSAALAWLSGARARVGYVRNARGLLLTHKLYHPRQGRRWLPTPAIDSYLQLAYAVGCKLEPPRLELATLPSDEAAADRVWNQYKLPHGERVVVLNSGGAKGAAKLWPTEYFAELARRLAAEQDLAVLVNCGPAERGVAQELVRLADHPRVVSLADQPLSIGLSKACIRRSRLLVTTDSGPRFFAVAFGVPVVSLFGPTDPDWTRTHYPREICLSHSVPCGPCARRACPLGHHDCMRLLTADRVLAAARELLADGHAVQAA